MNRMDKLTKWSNELPVSVTDYASNGLWEYAYLMHELDRLDKLIAKKFRVEKWLMNEEPDVKNGLPSTYRRAIIESRNILLNRRNEIEKQANDFLPKVITTLAMNNKGKYLVNKEVVVDKSYNDTSGRKERVTVPDPELMDKLKQFFE